MKRLVEAGGREEIKPRRSGGNASENYDITKCVMNDTTHYHDNAVNIQASSVSVPDENCFLPNPPPECNQPSYCPGVPWIE